MELVLWDVYIYQYTVVSLTVMVLTPTLKFVLTLVAHVCALLCFTFTNTRHMKTPYSRKLSQGENITVAVYSSIV